MEVDTTAPVVPQESKEESPSRKRLRDEKMGDSILLDSSSNSKKLKSDDSFVSLSTGGLRYFTITNNRAVVLDLEGWTLQTSDIDAPVHRFSGISLNPGSSLAVWFGVENQDKHLESPTAIWVAAIAPDASRIILKDMSGVTVCESNLRSRCPLQPLRLNLSAGFVTFVNVSNGDFDASSYQLRTMKSTNSFTFPEHTSIGVGSTVTVWSGDKATSSVNNPPHSFAWTTNSIFSRTGDGVMLLDPHEEIVACVADEAVREEVSDAKNPMDANPPKPDASDAAIDAPAPAESASS